MTTPPRRRGTSSWQRLLLLVLFGIAAIWLRFSLELHSQSDTAPIPHWHDFGSSPAHAVAATAVAANVDSSMPPSASAGRDWVRAEVQAAAREAEALSSQSPALSPGAPDAPAEGALAAKEVEVEAVVDELEAWLKTFGLGALAPRLAAAGLPTLALVRAAAHAPAGGAAAVAAALGPTAKKLDLARLKDAVQTLVASRAAAAQAVTQTAAATAASTAEANAHASPEPSGPVAAASAKLIRLPTPSNADHPASAPERPSAALEPALRVRSALWGVFPLGPPTPRWSGASQRSDNQIDLNLLQGEYQHIRVPWLRSFAARAAPHDCPATPAREPPSSSSSLVSLRGELLVVHSTLRAADATLQGKRTDQVHAIIAKIQSQVAFGGRALVTAVDGPYASCAALAAARACHDHARCVQVVGLGPCCALHPPASSAEGNGSSIGDGSSSSGPASVLVWPSGLGQAKDRIDAFNRVLAPLLLQPTATDDAATDTAHDDALLLRAASARETQARPQLSLSAVLGLQPTELVVCLARDDTLPAGAVSRTPPPRTREGGWPFGPAPLSGGGGVPWVAAAARVLRRNPRLAVASCFPKYPGHAYVDAPEYLHVPFKWLTYGLGLEDCAGADAAAATAAPSFHTPFAMVDAAGFLRERFAYAPFSPYGPQCFDLDALRHALPHLAATAAKHAAPLFRAVDARPLGVGAEVDLHLRLWRQGNASVGILDCGLEKPQPREEVFPSGAGLMEDNATKYAPSKLLRMVKTLLLNAPSDNELAEPTTAVAAREVQLAVALANHRVFQQRQRLLWPQATALDDTSDHQHGAPIPMMAQAGCQAIAADLPLQRYGDPAEGLTLVLMSYAGGVGGPNLRLTLRHYLDTFSRDLVREIVLVWNSPSSLLPVDIRAMAEESHPGVFRIVCFDTNSLLNRFHPRVAPKTQAVVFGDDDKHMAEASLQIGYLKWCCGNADRAVGGIGRRFWASKTGIEYHTSGRMQDMQMVIPTGLILDRGYLCHFWRRAFAPLHDFVNRSPSKPDDIAMNLLVQHLSGKGPRNYPQVVDRPGQLPVVTRRRRLAATQPPPRQRRRRILRPTNNATAAAREEASVEAYTAESETMRQGRRRLGMSGAAVWPLWRSDGALWTAYFFGGVPPISPGYCNEGVPVAKWKKGCDNSLPKADLPAAYGFTGAAAANDPTTGPQGGAKNAVPQPGQLPWEVGAYHGPKALPWLAACNASALFEAQGARRRRQATVAAELRSGGSALGVAGWGEAEGVIVSTAAATANEGGAADSKAQDVWDTVRVIAAMNPETRVVVTGLRTATPGGASKDNGGRQRVFLRDSISMLRQSLVVETLLSSAAPAAPAAPAAGLASGVVADEGGDEADGARLLLDALLRGLLVGSATTRHGHLPKGQAFNRTTWLDPAVALPCKGTLLPVPWLRPQPGGAPNGAPNGAAAATGMPAGATTLVLSGVGSEAAAEEVFRAASNEAPWVLWADFATLAATGEARGLPRPVAAGWAHADAAQASGALRALQKRWAGSLAAATWADVKAVLQEAGWDHLTLNVPSARLRAAPEGKAVRSAALPGACARGFKGCAPGVPCTCPFADCRVLFVRP